jgi:hypothetical protein
VRKSIHVGVSLLCTLVLGVGISLGSPYYLTDGNSSAGFDFATQAGQFDWTVDQHQQIAQQWFWYRIDNNPEASFDTISPPVVIQPTSNYLNVSYAMPGVFTTTVSFLLTGGQLGSGTSDIMETIAIHNTSGAPLDFHVFQYVDFDLNGTPGGDVVQILAPNTVQQTEGPTILSETVITPSSSHHEVAFFPQTLNSLNDLLPTTLNDVSGPLGPGDVTWAFQWDRLIPTGGTLIISKDKQINIPEPMTALLLVVGAAGAMLRQSRRR